MVVVLRVEIGVEKFLPRCAIDWPEAEWSSEVCPRRDVAHEQKIAALALRDQRRILLLRHWVINF